MDQPTPPPQPCHRLSKKIPEHSLPGHPAVAYGQTPPQPELRLALLSSGFLTPWRRQTHSPVSVQKGPKGPLVALETNASGSACSVAPVLSGAVRSPSMAGLKGSSAQCSWVMAPSRGSRVKCHVLSTATKSQLARRHVLLALLRHHPTKPEGGFTSSILRVCW